LKRFLTKRQYIHYWPSSELTSQVFDDAKRPISNKITSGAPVFSLLHTPISSRPITVSADMADAPAWFFSSGKASHLPKNRNSFERNTVLKTSPLPGPDTEMFFLSFGNNKSRHFSCNNSLYCQYCRFYLIK
jgi:hypothetical protein